MWEIEGAQYIGCNKHVLWATANFHSSAIFTATMKCWLKQASKHTEMVSGIVSKIQFF